MNILKDIIETNRSIIPKSVSLAVKNWPLIFVGLVYSIIWIVLAGVAPAFGILAGMIVTLVQSALISNYLYLIENIIRYGKVGLDDFKQGFGVYIWKVYGVLFAIWFVNYGASLFLSPILNISIGFISLWMILQLAAVIFLNPLPEVIYQRHDAVGESFVYAFEFIKENWLDWFVPNIVILIIWMLVTGGSFSLGMVFDLYSSFSTIRSIVGFGISQLILIFMMIYRGLLFQILSTSSRRKRMFMRGMYK